MNYYFTEYKKKASNVLHELASSYPSGSLDEQGVPAYLEGNFLSRWIFHNRIYMASKYLFQRSGDKCMDFGCGSGVLLPFLSSLFDVIYAIDIKPEFAQHFCHLWSQPSPVTFSNIKYFNSLESTITPDNYFDQIVALDSLEHVKNLNAVLERMHQLLKQNGHLLFSGPTENLFYRLGRKIVGFSGRYHHCSIYDVKKEVTKHFHINYVRKLPFLLPLFLLIDAEKR